MTIVDRRSAVLSIPVHSLKGPEVGLSDPHESPKMMRDEVTAANPPTHRSRACADKGSHLGDGEELQGIPGTTARYVPTESWRLKPETLVGRVVGGGGHCLFSWHSHAWLR